MVCPVGTTCYFFSSIDILKNLTHKTIALKLSMSFEELYYLLRNDECELLTAAEFEETVVAVQRKPGELHPLAHDRDVAPEVR